MTALATTLEARSAAFAIRSVPWIATMGEDVAREVAEAADRVTFRPGQSLVVELEVGDSMFLLVDGSARVTVNAGEGEVREVNVLRAGDTCGEIALLTRELRTATVTAIDQVVALRLERGELEAILARHPAIAVHFARELGRRLADTRAALDTLLDDPAARPSAVLKLAGHSSAVLSGKGSIRRAWRELVVGSRRELPFVALAAFVVSLGLVRAGAWGVEQLGGSLFAYLRGAYVLGFALLFASTATSLARFRPSWQRAIAVAFGVGFALILNELSVFLAFDTFYLDMTHVDPNMRFDVEMLYRRTESERAIWLMVAFLVQLAVLRRFYRRMAFVVRTRIVALASKKT